MVKIINGVPCEEVVRWEPIEKPTRAAVRKHLAFKLGQQHRKEGIGASSANGAYLDGYYSPDVAFFFITKSQAEAFNI